MRKLSILIFTSSLILSSCKQKEEHIEQAEEPAAIEAGKSYTSLGDSIDDSGTLAMAEMQERYQNLNIGDTIEVKFKSTVNDVCKSKGCWMKLENGEQEDVMVKFEDYGFFMPKDIENKEVIVSGKAYVTEIPVDEQRHYAEDAGKTEEEIAAITEPKRTLSFMANGVLIKEQ